MSSRLLSQPSRAPQPVPSGLYPRLLGAAWDELDPAVRQLHLQGDALQVAGSFQVRHGTHPVARCLVLLLRLPPAGKAVPIRLAVTRRGEGERWLRHFADRPLLTDQAPLPGGLLAERSGPVEFRLRLAAEQGALVYQQQSVALRIARVALVLPRWLAPRTAGRETPAGGARVHAAVTVTLPLVGPLIAYEGLVAPAEAGS
jgi:hypothetical protein